MKTEYLSSFVKDLKKIKNTLIYPKLKLLAFKTIPKCQNITEIKNIKKIKGSDNAYRIRIGDYRIGIFVENDTVIFSRVLHRKEAYRYFP